MQYYVRSNSSGLVQEVKIAGLDVYLAEPSSPAKTAILLVSDVFGWATSNIRLFADRYASQGGLFSLGLFSLQRNGCEMPVSCSKHAEQPS